MNMRFDEIILFERYTEGFLGAAMAENLVKFKKGATSERPLKRPDDQTTNRGLLRCIRFLTKCTCEMRIPTSLFPRFNTRVI